MRCLFLHTNFPAQFRHLCYALGREPGNETVFATMNPRPEWEIPGVRKAVFAADGEPARGVHPLARNMEECARKAAGASRTLLALRGQGFAPDTVYAHSGWGPSLVLPDVFPQARQLRYFEWYYDPDGADARFGGRPMAPEARTHMQARNLPILMDLARCHQGICPTRWQAAQFPPELRTKLTILHDGVDTDFFRPEPGVPLVLPGLDLSAAAEIVTYATRGMEPYRGFPEFMEAAVEVVRARPGCHVVVAGEDRACYGPPPAKGKTWKQTVLERLKPDPERIHFTGPLPYAHYRRLLQAGTAHVYLTRPFVLSWSCLEAMACGCLLVASDTGPVREVARHGVNALLTDLRPAAIAARMVEALEGREKYAALRAKARETVLRHFDLKKLLPRHLALLKGSKDTQKIGR